MGVGSQLVTLGPGNFEITESSQLPFSGFFFGDCTGSQTAPTQLRATGTISTWTTPHI